MDRSQFKATPITEIQEQEQEQKAKQPYGSDKDVYHKAEEGDNLFRIYPAHPDCKSFTQFQSKVFLEVMATFKDKDGVEQTKLQKKGLFNAIYHSSIMEKDVVNEYMSFAKAIHKENVNEKEWKRVWRLMAGQGIGKDSDAGQLKSSDEWMVYADKYHGDSKVFGLLGLKKTVKNGMNKISAEMAKDQGIDPFTDPDTGIRLIVNKNEQRGKEGGDWYECSLEKKWIDQMTQSFIPTPLSDTDLEFFVSQDSLCSRYQDAYTLEDFMWAMEGLERFDKTNSIGIFQYEEFRTVLNELVTVAGQLPRREHEEEAEDTAEAEVKPTLQPIQTTAAPAVQIQQEVAPTTQVVEKPAEVVKTGLGLEEVEAQESQQGGAVDVSKGYPANWDKDKQPETAIVPDKIEQAEQKGDTVADRLAKLKEQVGKA